MRLLIKFPSRSRPEKFMRVFQLYENMLSGEHAVMFVVTMDEEDSTMNNRMIRSFLENRTVPVRYFYGNSKSKIEAVNANLENLDADVLLLASDDMEPEYPFYDSLIYQKFQEYFPNYDGALKFHDGLRNDDLMTLCVMGWPLYKKFGYIYHPDYTSLYCDTEQTIVLHQIQKLAICPELLCRHKWSKILDDLHTRNESTYLYEKDKLVFDRRKLMNFEIDKLLKFEERLPDGTIPRLSMQSSY